MFKAKLYDFSSKFIYWAGLVNLFWLLFYVIVTMVFWPFSVLYAFILLVSFVIWRRLRARDKLAYFVQMATLAISTLIGAWVTLYILMYGVTSSEVSWLLMNDFFGFFAALFPNMGIGPGVFVIILDLFSKLIVSISGGNMHLAYHYGPDLLIASLIYLLIVVLYSVRLR